MELRSIRRLTNDRNHNAFTGTCWFKGALYVSWRQGDGHVCDEGRIIVTRSRDGGVGFDTVAVLRGQVDTRDAHLYTTGDRLFVVGFESARAGGKTVVHAGTGWTDNGLNWSNWTRMTGTENYVMWRPQWHRGTFYCMGYCFHQGERNIAWFTSADGVNWTKKQVVHSGSDSPNECALAFRSDDEAVILCRREHKSRKPLLLTAKPPYTAWQKQEIDIAIGGPMLWLVDDQPYIAGRWFPNPKLAHTAVFKLEGTTPVLERVMPSGPGWDHSYMAAAPHPLNKHRVHLSYYSDHTAHDDARIAQIDHPDIYLADAVFEAPHIDTWQVSKLHENQTLSSASPDKAGPTIATVQAGDDSVPLEKGFVKVNDQIAGKAGVIYLTADLQVGPCDRGVILLGYDGPVKVWLNGKAIGEAVGTNPAIRDALSIPVTFQHGSNTLVVALDSNGGKAWGIFGRFETSGA
jgi:hypothetical protein